MRASYLSAIVEQCIGPHKLSFWFGCDAPNLTSFLRHQVHPANSRFARLHHQFRHSIEAKSDFVGEPFVYTWQVYGSQVFEVGICDDSVDVLGKRCPIAFTILLLVFPIVYSSFVDWTCRCPRVASDLRHSWSTH
jgi:hypothetical protein